MYVQCAYIVSTSFLFPILSNIGTDMLRNSEITYMKLYMYAAVLVSCGGKSQRQSPDSIG